jgi:hypothetical protein
MTASAGRISKIAWTNSAGPSRLSVDRRGGVKRLLRLGGRLFFATPLVTSARTVWSIRAVVRE